MTLNNDTALAAPPFHLKFGAVNRMHGAIVTAIKAS